MLCFEAFGGKAVSEKKRAPVLGFVILILAAVGVVAIVRAGLDAMASAGREAGDRISAAQSSADAARDLAAARTVASADPGRTIAAGREMKTERVVDAAPDEPAEVDAPPGPSIGEPIAELQKDFVPLGIELQSSPLVDGTPRMYGASADQKTQIGLMGHRGVLEGVDVVFATGETARRNAIVIGLVLGATGWNTGAEWVASAVKNGGGKTRHGRVEYEVTTVVPGLYTLEARAAGASP